MTDEITILRAKGKRLSKTWNADGTIAGFDDAKYFEHDTVRVDGIAGLSELLTKLEADPHACIIRGRYVGDAVAAEREGDEHKAGRALRRNSVFEDQPLHALMLDVESPQLSADPLTDPEAAVLEFISLKLPPAFHAASCYWQLSNSAGHPSKAGEFRAHLWFWLATPHTSQEMKAWAKAIALEADHSVLQQVQIHYTAAPTFDGVADPVPRRSGFIDGLATEAVEIGPIPTQIEKRRKTKRGPVEGGTTIERFNAAHTIEELLAEYGYETENQTDWRSPYQESGSFATRIYDGYWVSLSGSDAAAGLGHETPNGARSGDAFDLFCHYAHEGDIKAALAAASVELTGEEFEPRSGGCGDGGDIGNARAFAQRFSGELACLFPDRAYVRWSGSRWTRCEHGEEIEAAKALAQEIVAAAAARYAESSSKADETRLKAAALLKNNKARLENMLSLAKSDPKLAMHARDFDADPWLLGVQNGVVDLRTGQLIAPDPAQRVMRQAGTLFDPKAACPRWRKFLGDVQPDPEIRAFLQRAVGYTLTGLPDEERIFFLHGRGANGKSVFATVLSCMFGDYHSTITPAALAKAKYGSNSEADRAIARLPGVRLALANETAQGAIWDDQRLKELASRDPIAARRLYQEAFDFTPTHTLWIRGNHLPGAHDAGDGFWRRMIPIPFKVQFTEAQRVPDLDRQLAAAELPGILAWAVEGCLAWQKRGLDVPTSLMAGVAEYRKETDLLGQWIEECLRRDPHGRARVGDAYRSYRAFCEERGVSASSQRQFTFDLRDRSIEATKGGQGVRIYKGFTITFGSFEELA